MQICKRICVGSVEDFRVFNEILELLTKQTRLLISLELKNGQKPRREENKGEHHVYKLLS